MVVRMTRRGMVSWKLEETDVLLSLLVVLLFMLLLLCSDRKGDGRLCDET